MIRLHLPRCLSPSLLAVTCLALLTSSASAGFDFELGNHPDGNARPPLYGLRLDNMEGTGGIYTFDFEYSDTTDSSSMMMSVDDVAGTVSISGTVYGGLNAGSGYASGEAAFWEVDFTYTGATVDVASGNLVSVTVDNPLGSGAGSITKKGTTETYSLSSKANSSGLQFKIETGHRGFSGFSGYGWLMIGTNMSHSKDWLFTATPVSLDSTVPAPPALALFAIGALGLVPAARRRRKTTDA